MVRRHVDGLPTPANPTPIKRIVVSAPRSGTMGLYFALQKLGYKPYHMHQVVTRGIGHTRMMNQAYDGEAGGAEHGYKKYTRADFDKWLQDYDIFMELPFLNLEATVSAYPDAQYLFVERQADRWATSIQNSVFQLPVIFSSTPLIALGIWCIPALHQMSVFAANFKRRLTNGHGDTPEGRRNVIANYERYAAEVRRLIPPAQLHCLKLEEGYGWEPVCKWLGVEVPDAEWPTKNTSEEFLSNVGQLKIIATSVGLAAVSAVVVPVAVVGWGLYTGRWEVPFTIQWK